MTAPVFIASSADLLGACAGGVVRLLGPEGRHAADVRRLRVGEEIDLVDGGGTRVSGVVHRVGTGGLEVAARTVQFEEPAAVRVAVLLALLKGDRFDAAVQMLTEIGVDEIIPWAAQRSIVQWRGERADRAAQRIAVLAAEAGKQSRRARFPTVSPASSSDLAVRRASTAAAAVVLHESAPLPLAGLALPAEGEILLVVGPEGGISDAELDGFGAVGATVARMGPTVLRSATAAVSAAAIVLAGCGRLGIRP